MQIKYTDLNIDFFLEDVQFHVLNLVYERFLRSIPKHSHSRQSYEIHYIDSGYGTTVIDGTTYSLRPGTLFVTGPDIEHEQSPLPSDPMEEYCIYLKITPGRSTLISSQADQITQLFQATPFWFGQDTHHFGDLAKSIFSEMESQTLGYRLQIRSLLQQCIINLVRNYITSNCQPRSNPATDSPFEPSNLSDQKYLILEECFLYEYATITLSSLSARLGLSTRQTERLLKEYYGQTFLQKRGEARMSAASILLLNTDKSISDIAAELGFSAIEHFSNAFKRHYGMSARAYKKLHQLTPSAS